MMILDTFFSSSLPGSTDALFRELMKAVDHSARLRAQRGGAPLGGLTEPSSSHLTAYLGGSYLGGSVSNSRPSEALQHNNCTIL